MKQKMKKIIIALCVLVLSCAAVYAWREAPRANPFTQIPREKIKKGEFVISIEEVGVIRAKKVESIYAPYSGKITKLIDEGTTVTKGQTVVWLDTEEVEKDLEEQITNLKSTKADLERTIEQLVNGMRNNTLKVESAVANLEFARLNLQDVNRKLETVQLLVDKNIVAKTQADTARQEVQSETYQTLNTDLMFKRDMKQKEEEESSQKSELGKVKLRSIKAKKKIQEAQDDISDAEVKSPSDGIFLLTERHDWHNSKNTKPQAGDQVWEGQALAEIPDLSSLVILSQVSEEDMSHMSVNQKARITTDAFKDLKLNASVSRIGMVAIPRNASPAGSSLQGSEDTGQKVFELDLVMEKHDVRLRPGMTANVSIILETMPDALTIPLSAVFRKEGRSVVFTLTKNGYKTRFVTLGRRNGNRVEILSGLNSGEEVFLKDLGELDRES
jgi:multidrug efflux pump subunit AcrA (membrane-fusion protein)